MMAFSQEYSFGAINYISSGLSVASLAANLIPGVGTVVSIVLKAVNLIYGFITGDQQRSKMEHMLVNQYIQQSIQMGKEVLISYGYNKELVNQLPIAGLYAIPNLYDDKQALINELSIYGIDASRFIYEAPVLKPQFTGNIERDLRVRELLIYTGYDSEQVNKTDWKINVNIFDALNKLSTASTGDEMNTQIERTRGLLSTAGLDPTKFMQTILQSKPAADTVPSPTAVITNTALQAPGAEVQKAGFSLSPLIIVIGIGILVLSQTKG